MKRVLPLFLALLLLGCASTQHPEVQIPSVPESTPAESPSFTVPETGDLDLRAYDAAQAFLIVFELQNNPDVYLGRTVILHGTLGIGYLYSDGSPTAQSKTVYSCIMQEGDEIYMQGLEFELSSGGPYPERGTEITVAGTFGTYTENGLVHCQLGNARIIE